MMITLNLFCEELKELFQSKVNIEFFLLTYLRILSLKVIVTF